MSYFKYKLNADWLPPAITITRKDWFEFTPTPTGINSNENDLSVTVFPNPVSSTATVEIKGNSNNSEFILFDLNGKKVSETKFTSSFTFEKNNLDAGIYFYTFMVDDKAIATKKIVISSK